MSKVSSACNFDTVNRARGDMKCKLQEGQHKDHAYGGKKYLQIRTLKTKIL